MQVCKLFLKIIKKNIGIFLMYIGIFSLITVILISGQSRDTSYKQEKVFTYVLVEEETKESKEVLSFLNPYISLVELKNEEAIEDALFWNDIDLYIFIPKNFMEKVLNGEPALTMKSAPDSLEAQSIVSTLNSFFNLVNENIRLGLCEKEYALSYTKEVFLNNRNTNVTLEQNKDTGQIRGMFDIGTYVINSILLFIIGLVSFNMRKLDINRRLRISAYPTGKRNLILGLCYSILAILFVAFIACLGICLFPKQIDSKLWLYILNACLFSITMVFLALFLSSLFKSSMAYSCLANVLPLVAAFLCGAFVGIDLLPDATKAIGHVFPNIYIILGNQYIQTAQEFQFGTYLSIVWPCFLFIAVSIIGSIIVTNYIAKSEN